jgi:uncharacterized protein YeaO (DUF488 family)
MITIKRVYDEWEESDGCRILVDRLWPRGLSKERAKIDHWLKDVAPSNELRKWYGHDPEKWPEFKRRYYEELAVKKDLTQRLLQIVRENSVVTLLYSSKEEQLNNAVALKEYLEEAKNEQKSISR